MVLRSKRWWMALGLGGAVGACDSGAKEAAHQPPGDAPTTSDDPPATTPDDPATVSDPADKALARVDQNLATLRALELFDVGKLLVDVPGAHIGSCYNRPCAGEADALRAAEAADLDRLVALAADLETAPNLATSAPADCDLALVDGDIATLRSLSIIEVGDFLAVEPANNWQCYNLPCDSDVQAAAVASCERAARLGELAARAAAAFDVPLIATPGPSEAMKHEDDNLAVLQAFDLFPVGDLLVGATVERESCYVCPIEEVTQDEPMAAERLSDLVAAAEQTIADYRDTPASDFAGCDPSVAVDAISSLRALEIVEVGDLYDRDAAEESLCYAGRCTPAQEAEADALTCRRAAAAAALARATFDL